MNVKAESIPAADAAPGPLSRGVWLWIALLAVTGLCYLLPLSLPGATVLMLLGLVSFWVGVIAAFWPHRTLRLLPLLVAALSFYPIRTESTRLLMLCGLALLWIAAAIVLRKRRGVTFGLAAVACALAAFAVLPGRPADGAVLRAEYVRSLKGFQGTAYVWGGENGVGIDCSGLIRCGWVDATLRTGLRTLNPGLVREAAEIWWQDCSAEEIGEGYRHRTDFEFTAPALSRIDYRRLDPGDVVVTDSGAHKSAHTMAYLGNDTWIMADPQEGSVITLREPAPKAPWFAQPMKVVRWRQDAQ